MLITLTTDFGLRDGYVAAMKGAILSRAPAVLLVDVTHEIPPGAIGAAAYVLRQATGYFPDGTIHLAVVDPGVGSGRRGIVCKCGSQLYVAPDNGVLAAVLDTQPPVRTHSITRSELWRPDPSPVFHGRDIFGPVAAHLASGGRIEDVGDAIDPASLVGCPWPRPSMQGEEWKGAVIYVDRFGNLVTNLPLEPGRSLEGSAEIDGRRCPLARTYSEVSEGELVALRGSSGLLEIACHAGNAARILGAEPGHVVTFRVQTRS
jgi:S-adenosylmethionine hydrolase